MRTCGGEKSCPFRREMHPRKMRALRPRTRIFCRAQYTAVQWRFVHGKGEYTVALLDSAQKTTKASKFKRIQSHKVVCKFFRNCPKPEESGQESLKANFRRRQKRPALVRVGLFLMLAEATAGAVPVAVEPRQAVNQTR
jgi:hypothetical protein